MGLETTVVFLLALVRVSAMVLTAPVLGSRSVPFRFRIVLAGVLTLATLPLIDSQSIAGIELEAGLESNLISMALSEVIIGTLLGLGVMIVFAAAQMAGTVIGQMAGIQMASGMDPQSGEATSPVSQMFGILSLAAFALIGGPELVVTATLDTFSSLPIGTTLQTSAVIDLTAELLQQSFLLTLRGVAPAVAALLISTLVIGLISRSYPQMNLLGMGLSSNLIVMMLAIFFTLGGCVWLFVDDLERFIAMIQNALIDSQAMEIANHE